MKKIILMLLLLTCVLCSSCGKKETEPKDPAGKELTWETKYKNEATLDSTNLYEHSFRDDMVYVVISKIDANVKDKVTQEKFINSFCDNYSADNYDYTLTTELNPNNVEVNYLSIANSEDAGTYQTNVVIFGDNCVYAVCSSFLADNEEEHKAKEEKFIYKLVDTMDFE